MLKNGQSQLKQITQITMSSGRPLPAINHVTTSRDWSLDTVTDYVNRLTVQYCQHHDNWHTYCVETIHKLTHVSIQYNTIQYKFV